jgi:hypothetical protein
MDWMDFQQGQQDLNDAGSAAQNWVERLQAAIAGQALQSGDTGRALQAFAQLEVFRAENRR